MHVQSSCICRRAAILFRIDSVGAYLLDNSGIPVSKPVSSLTADRLGIFASTACAVHCVAVAFLPAALGALGFSALLTHEAEWAFTLVAVGFASVALLSALRGSGSLAVLSLLGVGIIGLFAARFIEEAGAEGVGTVVAFGAGFALVLGHMQNLRKPLRQPSCRSE